MATSTHPPDPVLVTHALTKHYGPVTAVDGVSVAIRAGRVTALLGPNGSGKTTFLQMTLGLVRPTSGTAHVLGQPYRELDRPTSRVGVLLDTDGIHPGRTARDHLRVVALSGGVDADRVDEVLLAVGLTEAAGRKARTYSLGMRQRLRLATALLGDPELLVLDEPANGLDPAGIRWLRESLRAYVETGGSVLLASHVLSEVEQGVDDVLVLHRGRVVAAGALGDVADGRALEDAYLELTSDLGEVRRAG